MASLPFDPSPGGSLDDPHQRRRFARTSPWHRVPYDYACPGMHPEAWSDPPNPDPSGMATFCRPLPPWTQPRETIGDLGASVQLPVSLYDYLKTLDGQTRDLQVVLGEVRALAPAGAVVEADLVYQDISLWWEVGETRTIWRLILFSPSAPTTPAPFAPPALTCSALVGLLRYTL